MMNDDIRNRLNQCLSEERNDVQKYRELAKLAHDNGANKVCAILKDISDEEETHANLIEELL